MVIDGEGAETISGKTTRKVQIQYGAMVLQCDGSNWLILEGEFQDYVLEIGDWNMDANSQPATLPTHGLSEWGKIRYVRVIIRNDADTIRHQFDSYHGSSTHHAGYVYQINSTQILLQRSNGVKVQVAPNDSDDNPDLNSSEVVTLTNPGSFTADALNTFTAPADATLDAETTYHVVVSSANEANGPQFRLNRTNSNSEDSGRAAGWRILDYRKWRSSGTSSWSMSSSTKLQIQIKGSAVAATNTPATGAPTISGTTTVGQTLTAATSGIADTDGLTNVSYSYQWIRVDSGTETDISGATSSTYTLVNADVGKTIKVKVTFDDDAGNSESLTSAATAAVALPEIAIEANHPVYGAGVDVLVFTLTREGAATAALDVTVTLAQDETWLSTLSHTVSFAADDAEATLTLQGRDFSSTVTTSGNLTATVGTVSG